jgi:NAD(P)-dependent dehydrogenase (short-subunit alcohol dehydrogenase family)
MTTDSSAALGPFRLDGKHVLITGAGGGIGGAMVRAFQAAGAHVTGADRSDEILAGLDVARKLAFDFTDAAATAAAMAGLIEQTGAPDVLVNNAAHTRAEALDDVDAEVWAREINVNLNGAFHVTMPIVAGMVARGGGAIVFISTVNALAYFGNPAYSAAKAGMVAYAKAIAVEHGQNGVRANVICPGSVRTRGWTHRFERDPQLLDHLLPHYPLGRMVLPEEVAQTAVFLASPAASGITGAVLPVDAGLTAGNLRFVRDVIQPKKV